MHAENRFARRPLRTLALATVVLGLLGLLLDVALALTLQWLAPPPQPCRIFHPRLHHALAANREHCLQQWGGESYEFATNSLGMIDSAASQVALRSRTPRVLVMGDSFAEGTGVPPAHSWTGLLRARLAPRIELLNAGVRSYSPSIHLVKARDLLAQGLSPREVILLIDISDPDDEFNRYRLDRTGAVVDRSQSARTSRLAPPLRTRVRDFVNEHTWVTRRALLGARELLQWMRPVPLTRSRHVLPWIHRRGGWTTHDELWTAYGKAGMDLAQRHMAELATLLSTHGVGLSIVVYPWPEQLLYDSVESKQVRLWRAWAQEHEVRFEELFSAFHRAGPAVDVVASHFIQGDVHWNRRGHRFVADELERRFFDDGDSGGARDRSTQTPSD